MTAEPDRWAFRYGTARRVTRKAPEVDVERAAPVFLVDVLDAADRTGDAGAGDDDVEPAEAGLRLREAAVDVG